MLQRMELFEQLRAKTAQNEWNEQISEWKAEGRILAAISTATGKTLEQNAALRVQSTHRGLTLARVQTGDRLKRVGAPGETYTVDYVIEGTRYRQLLLSREAEIGK